MSTTNGFSHFIRGKWIRGNGVKFDSLDPSDNSVVWQGNAADEAEISLALKAARDAWEPWWGLDQAARIEFAIRFSDQVKSKSFELAELISRENGKPLWEAKTEVAAVVGKSALAIDALRQRRDTTAFPMDGFRAVTRYRPHGVLGVLGPYNFPAHLPNGHIVPALIAGNTIVFKPSELTPAVGQWMVERWHEVGLPDGVINLVQGGRETGVTLAGHSELDGLLFTGSSNAGLALSKAFAKWPQKILALEMGGNNPLVACDFSDPTAAAYTVLQSSFLSAGQRCTCARRLIILDGDKQAEVMLEILIRMVANLKIGYWNDEPEPFMGPLVNRQAGRNVLAAQTAILEQGGIPFVMSGILRDNEALVSPGVLDVTQVDNRSDHEVFGPLLSLVRVNDFDAAIQEANRTAYGLAAGLISDSVANYEKFIKTIRAGIVNWNRQTTGASGKLPFGGCGLSGNNRPSGFFAADYCSWPIASLESEQLEPPSNLLPGVSIN
ncbi:MAG TPA: succinylglutamate-semialdehyde dehydrogenase [Pirellulaceae bacterium]|nr:succinylglutamate-semialdehyde dehydrogenase [Pirellulaceae bacterium]HMO91488.1 succinylglutamate-semialdehyde dehydrogenase [Pirellulaceae bacterium]HMP70957.1 succinylglutamate-semialdehyde dehydrogenase [Pirellulaceae bacterium]